MCTSSSGLSVLGCVLTCACARTHAWRHVSQMGRQRARKTLRPKQSPALPCRGVVARAGEANAWKGSMRALRRSRTPQTGWGGGLLSMCPCPARGPHLLYRHHHVHALDHPPKHGVLAVQPGGGHGCDEELRQQRGGREGRQHEAGGQAGRREARAGRQRQRCARGGGSAGAAGARQGGAMMARALAGGQGAAGGRPAVRSGGVGPTWLPFVLGPALAMDSVKGRSWRRFLRRSTAHAAQVESAARVRAWQGRVAREVWAGRGRGRREAREEGQGAAVYEPPHMYAYMVKKERRRRKRDAFHPPADLVWELSPPDRLSTRAVACRHSGMRAWQVASGGGGGHGGRTARAHGGCAAWEDDSREGQAAHPEGLPSAA